MPCAPTRLSRISLSAAIAAALAIGVATPAHAGPYFLKIEGVDGESTDKDHGKWIDILSVDWGSARPAGTPEARRDKKKGKVEYSWKVEEGTKAQPGPRGQSAVAAPHGSSEAGLLVPAVQKVRASMKGSYPGCREGMVHDRVSALASDGRHLVMRNVTITSCTAEQVTFVFNKIR